MKYDFNFPVSSEYTNNNIYYLISSPFGFRKHPINKIKSFHYGIDICGLEEDCGLNINAIAEGTIERVSKISNVPLDKPRRRALGNHIIQSHKHSNGITFYFMYCHLKEVKDITLGQSIKKGEVIGVMGKTGDYGDPNKPSTKGVHLHFEIWINDFSTKMNAVDPALFIENLRRKDD